MHSLVKNLPEIFDGQCTTEVSQYLQQHIGPVTTITQLSQIW